MISLAGADPLAELQSGGDYFRTDAITFKYVSPEHKTNTDTTDGEFVVGSRENIVEVCREPLFSLGYIDLRHPSFWFYLTSEETDHYEKQENGDITLNK